MHGGTRIWFAVALAMASARCGGDGSGVHCGDDACQVGEEFCLHVASDVAGSDGTYSCKPLPAACTGSAGCACLDGECGDSLGSCNGDSGGFVLTCPGG